MQEAPGGPEGKHGGIGAGRKTISHKDPTSCTVEYAPDVTGLRLVVAGITTSVCQLPVQ
jgi:hypothetical protein